ncbi:MAG: hypothetical protein BWY74_01313 [Firmicutes bacterium ADurb.Bin419]|nr:MAG: hypothetical protein BWY74_01313 [Firmicutes bacterium ADurb.Bin419]
MRCPNCKLRNTDRTVKCSCGYNFLTKSMDDGKSGIGQQKPNRTLLTLGWITAIIGGPIGVIIAFFIGFGRVRETGEYIYDEESRRMGRIMLLVSIITLIIGFVLGAR